MSISTKFYMQTSSPFQQEQTHPLAHCTLKWKRGQLLVKLCQPTKQNYLATIEDKEWLAERLQHCPVTLIQLDKGLGEARLRLWADASEQANRKAFLQIPSYYELHRKCRSFSWMLKRLLDWATATVLLLALSPLMLTIVLLMSVLMPGPIFFRQWRVGQRGRLFRIIKFRTMVVDAEKLHHQVMSDQKGLHKLPCDPRTTQLGRWMRKYSFDELPQLFNVLRGEMSLVGPRPWALYDALRISSEGQKRLNALPGITGPWQVGARSNLLDLHEVNNLDLDYLRNWSLGLDLKILLLTIPRVILGSGAY